MEHTIQRIHIRSIFGLFIPLCSVNGLEARPHVAEDYFGFSLFNNSVGGLRYSIQLFCRQGVSKEYEQCNCFDWAKRNPISFQSSDGINGTGATQGIIIRLKIKQGVFDFRKTNKLLVRIHVVCFADGAEVQQATSEKIQLLPKKRYSNNGIASEEGTTQYIILFKKNSCINCFFIFLK
jgi:hypothetical protein